MIAVYDQLLARFLNNRALVGLTAEKLRHNVLCCPKCPSVWGSIVAGRAKLLEGLKYQKVYRI